MSIDHLGEQPAYLQLAAILREMIASGEIAVHDPLPGIATLAQRYELARGTVVRALGVLKAEGLVRTVPGRGIYVVSQP